MKSIVKHSVCLAGRRTSISLENEFWAELKKIAAHRRMTISGLIREIKANRQNGNVCSAIRLYVLRFYRDQSATGFALEADAQEAGVGREVDRAGIGGEVDGAFAPAPAALSK